MQKPEPETYAASPLYTLGLEHEIDRLSVVLAELRQPRKTIIQSRTEWIENVHV